MGRVEPTTSARWPLVGRGEELERCVEALTSGQVRAVFVHGPAGVGKTRLAEEVVGRITKVGRATQRVRASLASSALPLGAVAHLLPSDVLDRSFDPLSVYAGVVASLRVARAGRGPLVILVDDAQWLDQTSAVLFGQLLDGGELALVGTVRTGEDAPPAVAGLWRRDDVGRVDLGELTYADVDALLHLVLGGPVDHGAIARLWSASAGNPLFVRELVLGALAGGDLVQRRSVWWLGGTLASTPRLSEIISRRIADASVSARSALDVLGVWDSVGLRELTDLCGAGAVEELERAGLVEVRVDRRRQSVALAHPLHGEVVRAELPTTIRNRILLERADRIEAHGARRREDVLLVATARLEGGGEVDAHVLTSAARIARAGFDFALVDRLTAAVVAAQPSAEAVLLRAEALHERSDYAQVEELLAGWPIQTAHDETVDVQLAAMRVRNLMWGLDRADDSLRVNRETRAVLTSVDSIDELITDEALTLVHTQRPTEALAALAQMSATPAPRSRVLRAIAEVPAQIALGRCETALAMTLVAHAEHRALGDQTAIAHRGVHVIHRIDALTDAGRISEARAIAADGYERVARSGRPLGRDWLGIGLGRAALLGGQPRTAARWLSECVELSATNDFDAPRRLELSYLAIALAWSGELDDARRCLAEQDVAPPSPFRELEQPLGAAWVLAAAGDLSGARRSLLQIADRAEDSDQRALAAWVLHDVARIGGADDVVERLAAVADECEGALAPAYAASAGALARHEAAGLDDAAERFAAMDMYLLAAEVATAAAEAHRLGGARRSASASSAQAATWWARCEGALTPGLVSVSTAVPLTRREREISGLAAAGSSSRDIATQLFLSERTVENHLQNVYTKLGVTSRSELADALGSGLGSG